MSESTDVHSENDGDLYETDLDSDTEAQERELEKDSETNQDDNEKEAQKHKPPWYKDGNVYRLVILLTLTLILFVAELVVGLITNSLALVSDAFHMASDALALGIGLIALQMAKKNASPGSRFTYGLGRAEVIGGLVNGVFLLSISMFIVYEALSRFIEEPVVDEPLLIVYVGSAGLLINVLGLFLFIGHSGVGHGHSHGHGHKKKKEKSGDEKATPKEEKKKKKKKRRNLNLHGVFLHVLGDALASIGAIISGLLIEFLPWEHRFYIDPILSILISLLIMKSSIPLIWSSIQILMQSGPKGLDMSGLSSDIEKISNVLRVHDLHVWQLLGDKPIASIHVLCKKPRKFMKTARKIKAVFHERDIHTVTIQPEFVGRKTEEDNEKECLLHCKEDCDSLPV